MLRTTHFVILMAAATLFQFQDCAAQIMIGGPNGVVIGGGRGLSIGGRDGVNFRRGYGMRFGPPTAGLQIGGGQGFRAGTYSEGLQIGAGQGFRAGTPYEGFQFGTGQGVQAGYINPPPVGATTATRPAYVPAPTATSGAMTSSGSPSIRSPRPTNASPVPSNRDVQLQGPQSGNPFPRTQGAAGQNRQTIPDMIVLQNPRDNGRTIRYSINGTPFQLPPGNSVRMKPGTSWKIGLPGSNGATQDFVVKEAGTYLVTKDEAGWTLFSNDGEPVSKVESHPVPAPAPVEELPEPVEELPPPLNADQVQTKPQPPATTRPVAPAPAQKPKPDTKKETKKSSKSVLEFNDKKKGN